MDNGFDTRALWSCSYGIYIVSSCDGEGANGQITNTVIQVSAEPPRISVAINKQNYTHGFIDRSGVMTVSVLGEDTPLPFIGRFGFRSGREIDKFEDVEFKKGTATGCPCVTENAVSIFEGKVFDSVDVGTHTVFFADVVSGEVLGDSRPMTYAQYHAKKGRAPKTAPTYRKDEE